MLHSEDVSYSPVQNFLNHANMQQSHLISGCATAFNVLSFFLGTPEIVTQVLFLGSTGDLRNALHMVGHCSEAYHELDIHMSDSCPIATAKNYLLAQVMLADHFDPSNSTDLQYLWELWYACQWTESTRRRFVNDVRLLLANKSPSSNKPSVIPHQGMKNVKFPNQLKKIFNSWLNTACNTTIKETHQIVKQRLQYIIDSGTMIFNGIEETIENHFRPNNPSFLLASVKDIANIIADKMGIKRVAPSTDRTMDEIKYYLNTGDFEPKTENIVCFNPTLLTLGDKLWQGHCCNCPLDAYFPLSLSERLEEKFSIESSPYTYSKAKLEMLVTKLKLRKEVTRFHFYFGESIELCLTNECLKNKMHVIHCSGDFVYYAGLANILPAVSQCLNSDMPEAVLVTENFYSQIKGLKAPLFNHLERVLSCPLTMIPTVYGVRLLDHLHLGSSICCQLHDNLNLTEPITLKWYKLPQDAHSSEIQFEFTPALTKIIRELAQNCFHFRHAFSFPPEVNDPFRALILQFYLPENHLLPRHSPLTFYFIFQSLMSRCTWKDGAIDLLIQQCIPACFRLAWKSLEAWMNGEQVILFHHTASSEMQGAISIAKSQTTGIARIEFVLKAVGSTNSHHPGQIVDASFFSGAHFIYNLNWNNSSPADVFTLSFLLTKSHSLDSTTQIFALCYVGVNSHRILYSTSLTSQVMRSQVVVNRNPHRIVAPNSPPKSFPTIRCQESEDEYNLEISFQRKNLLNSIDYRVPIVQGSSTHQFDLLLPTSRFTAAEKSHLTIKLAWPVLTKGIKLSFNSDKLIHITAKKCLDDAWPVEYGGRSKWDLNRFLPWKEFPDCGLLYDHMQAQFECNIVHSSFLFMKNDSIQVLDEVRDIIRAIFYSHYHSSFQLIAVHGNQNPQVPIFLFRIHPPIRFSPHGSPLLLVSVIDYQRAEDLIREGKLNREAFQSEYHRLITERVSKEVCVIRASTDEEVNLLRYLLRVNSTKMRRSAWQSKNLPRGENSPWIPTFISPLYCEQISLSCDVLEENLLKQPSKLSLKFRPTHPEYRKSCTCCYVNKVPLKACSRCRSVYYCSTYCQRLNWSSHKVVCALLPLDSVGLMQLHHTQKLLQE